MKGMEIRQRTKENLILSGKFHSLFKNMKQI
jgi:hypothetical protein